MFTGNPDTFFPDMITDVITDLSDHPIRYESLILTSRLRLFAPLVLYPGKDFRTRLSTRGTSTGEGTQHPVSSG